MTSAAIDITVIGIVAFCAWRGYKNGLIRGVFGIVSLIASLLIANAAAQAYSQEAKPVLIPFATGLVESTLTEMEENDIVYQPGEHDIDSVNVLDLFGGDAPQFGTAYTILRQLGLPEAASVTVASRVAQDPASAENRSSFISVTANKITDALSYVAVFGIAFLILAIVCAIIGNLVGFVFSLPGLRLVDIISGAVFGLAKGIIIIYAIAVVVRYFGILAPSALSNTVILNYLITNNPIASTFGL